MSSLKAPFKESHGHIALEEFNMPMRVTAITHRRNAIILVPISARSRLSESSVIKRVSYEPLFLTHLRDTLSIKGVKRVSLHEKLTGLLRVTVIVMAKGTLRTEVWRALNGAAFFKGDMGKITIAVSEDIDPDNADAILWAMAYRMNPIADVQTVAHRGQGHGPKRESEDDEDSTLLMDATAKSDMPPLALPTRPYMERAKAIWDKLGLPPIRPQAPWFGYSLGDWAPEWDVAAERAATGRYLENGRISEQQRRKGVKPETKRPGRTNRKSGSKALSPQVGGEGSRLLRGLLLAILGEQIDEHVGRHDIAEGGAGRRRSARAVMLFVAVGALPAVADHRHGVVQQSAASRAVDLQHDRRSPCRR